MEKTEKIAQFSEILRKAKKIAMNTWLKNFS